MDYYTYYSNILNDYLLALTNQSSIRGISPFSLYQQTFLSIVPMVNPDGVDLVIQGPQMMKH